MKLKIFITEKDYKNIDKHTDKMSDYPYYCNRSNVTAEEIIILSKLSEYEIDNKLDEISIKLVKG